MRITNESGLRELYSPVKGRARLKQLDKLEKHSRNFISHSPFLVLSTSNLAGKLDSSPRGGAPGFVEVIDDKTVLIPDAKGNNRIDSLITLGLIPRSLLRIMKIGANTPLACCGVVY